MKIQNNERGCEYNAVKLSRNFTIISTEQQKLKALLHSSCNTTGTVSVCFSVSAYYIHSQSH